MSTPSIPSPYKGLVPYDESDAPFFFGRQAETEIISANLAASRLTLLYGASGVGKSSVLRAGVAHSLRTLSEMNLAQNGAPEFVVIVFANWRDDPVLGLQTRLQEVCTQLYRDKPFEPPPPSNSLTDSLKMWSERIDGDLLIILDQFEEYFLYHAHQDGDGTFAMEFPRAVNRRGLRANFLISIREDALARLDFFKGRIPNLFDNYLRIQHLDHDAARDAITKPLETFNASVPVAQQVSIEPALVNQVLDQLEEGKVRLSEGGRGIIEGGAADADSRIETPFLQLVMTRLWNEELISHSRTLHLATLTRLGGPERIVKTHLDEAMNALPANERDIAANLFRYLVTPSGTKIAYSAFDISEYAQLPVAQVTPVLEKLAGSVRILRSIAPPPGQGTVARYEIFHDVLAGAILDWRTRYTQAKEQAKEVARTRRIRIIGASVGVAAALIILFLFFNNVQTQAALSKSNDTNKDLAGAVLTENARNQTTEPNATPAPTSASVATALAALTQIAQQPPPIAILPSATFTPPPATQTPTRTETPDSAKTADALLTLAATIRPTPTFTPTPTNTLTRTPTPIPPTPIPPTPTPTEIPRLVISKFETSPPNPVRNQDIVFHITFHNSFASHQTRTWQVWIYQEDNLKKNVWASDKQTVTLQPGDTLVTTVPTWAVRGPGDTLGFVAFVKYVNDDSSTFPALNSEDKETVIGFLVIGGRQ